MRQQHQLEPIYDDESRILILGSFPSVKSREANFYYGHKMNRFWPIMERLFSVTLSGVEDKKAFLSSYRIALWDVIESCEIKGSSDVSISEVVPNDIRIILSRSPIDRIFVNGTKARDLYVKYIYPNTGIEPELLPSTSPANASWSLDKLCQRWAVIKDYL